MLELSNGITYLAHHCERCLGHSVVALEKILSAFKLYTGINQGVMAHTFNPIREAEADRSLRSRPVCLQSKIQNSQD